MTIGVDVAQLFAQSLEPSGKRGLVVLRLFAITFFACVVGHAFDTRVGFGKITTISTPKVARTILDWVYTSQELHLRRNPLKTNRITTLARKENRALHEPAGGAHARVAAAFFAA